MATSSLQTLIIIPLLSSIALLLTTLANTAESAPDKGSTVSFAYNFELLQRPTDLTYQGDAFFPTTNPVLRLTKTDENVKPQPFSIGRVIYSKPVIFSNKKKQASFQTKLKYFSSPTYDNDTPADGLVFFIAPFNSSIGDSGSSFGVFDASGQNPNVFAVEFDTYYNEGYDPYSRHVGIDIKSHVSSNTTALYGDDYAETTALITYDATTKLISVSGTFGRYNFELSYVYDLSTMLPQEVEIGISAATGMNVAIHDVAFWSFNSEIVHVK